MRTKLDTQIKKYIHSVSNMIPNTYTSKKQLLCDLEQSIQTYLTEHPDASWQNILEEFGSASEVADGILSNLPKTDKIPFIKRQNHLYITFFITCIIIIGIGIFLLVYQHYWDSLETFHVDYRVNPPHYIYNDTEISSEEFEEKN